MKIEDIVIYAGSLAELNSRDESKKFGFARELHFISKGYQADYECVGDLEGPQQVDFSEGLPLGEIKKEILTRGYRGIINCRTNFFKDHVNTLLASIEGTPII